MAPSERGDEVDDLQRDLHDLWSAISGEWQDLQDDWHDSAADHYRIRHWEPMEEAMQSYLAAVEHLAETMAQISAMLRD